MEESPDPLEAFWDWLLSGQPELIRQAYSDLDEAERQSVLAHLSRMTSEPGWQPEQRASARAALDVLGQHL